MDLSSNSVINMLDHVDCAESERVCKRREAYVTEWYFEHQLLPAIIEGPASSGWCYVDQRPGRHWFRVVDNSHLSDEQGVQRETDRQIVRWLMAHVPGQRFFTVYEKQGCVFLREIVSKTSGLWQTRVQDPDSICQIAAMNTTLTALCRNQAHREPFVGRWLGATGEHYRTSLLLQRVLMNVGLKKKSYFPVDVDAIEITHHTLVFHEFKRKTMCPNGSFLTPGQTPDVSFLFNTLSQYRSTPAADRAQRQHFVGYARDPSIRCYGLDLSHCQNVEYCQQNNIAYRYTIWDSGDYPDKPAVSDLFDEHLEVLHGIRLLSCVITSVRFIGFIFTDGANSGSLNQQPRIQASLSADDFDVLSERAVPVA